MIVVLALVLIIFGFLAGFSIGPPFFILGVALLILSPFRSHARIFWPLIAGLVGLLAGGYAVYPYSCAITSDIVTPTTSSGPSQTVCTSLIGVTWSGTGLAQPPSEAGQLALMVGLIAGATTASAAWMVVAMRARGSVR